MNPVRVEVEHFELIVHAGQKLRLCGQAGSGNDRRAGFLDGNKILGMGLVLEDLLQAVGFGLQPVLGFTAASGLAEVSHAPRLARPWLNDDENVRSVSGNFGDGAEMRLCTGLRNCGFRGS